MLLSQQGQGVPIQAQYHNPAVPQHWLSRMQDDIMQQCDQSDPQVLSGARS